MAQLKSGSTIGGTGVLLNEANSVSASNITDGVVTAAKLAGAGTAGQVLTSTGGSTAPSMQDLSVDSSSLSADFTVETGKSVAQGDVVNYFAGKIGTNPVVNTLTSAVTDGNYSYDWLLPGGKVVVRNETSSYPAVRVGLVQTSGSINWGSIQTITTSDYGGGAGIQYLGGNRFSGYVDGSTSGGSWSPRGDSAALRFFSVDSSTGSISLSSQTSSSFTTYNYGNMYYRATEMDADRTNKIAVRRYTRKYPTPNDGTNTTTNDYYNSTFVNTGGISLNSGNSSDSHSYSDGLLVSSSTKMLGPRNSTTWYISDWSGSNLSNQTDITFESEYDSTFTYKIYRPSLSVDRWLVAYINASQVLKVDTYSFTSGAIVRENEFTILSGASGVSIGGLSGTGASGTGVILSYENDAKGYVVSLNIDSNSEVTATGIALKHNDSNAAPAVSDVYDTDKVTALFNNAGSRVVSRILQVNAFSTTALNWLGVAKSAGGAASTVSVTIDGVASGFSGLTAGTTYYYNTVLYDASVSTTVSDYLIGTAISATEIKING